jgi:KTSC domain
MDRIPVSSSNIAQIGYEPDSQILEIQFLSGGVYQYSSVPPSVFDEFMAASSKGRYFSAYVKDRYPTTRVG